MERPGASSNFADTDAGRRYRTAEAGTEGGTTAGAGINGSRARLPFSLDPARTPVLGSWRRGIQQPAVLRSAWYRLPPTGASAIGPRRCWWCRPPGRFDRGEVQSCSGPPTTAAEPAGRRVGFADVGAPPAWRNLRAPLAAIPRRRHPGPAGRHRRRPGPAALDRGHPAADPAAAHAAGRRRLAGPGAAGLAGRPGLPVPAPVRPPERRRSRRRSGASCRTGSAPRPTRR